jgi:NitT/TauT family transport system permease protein
MGWYRRVAYVLDPFVNAFYATPRVALLPLVVIWVGIGIWSKIAIVFLGAVFPVLLSTYSGVRTTDARLLRAARSFGADDLQIFRTLILPGSVPFIVTGLRLGVGRALIGVVVGELYAATAGIGFLISVAGNSFQTDKVFVGVLLIALVGIVSMELLGRLERRFERWRPAVGAEI